MRLKDIEVGKDYAVLGRRYHHSVMGTRATVISIDPAQKREWGSSPAMVNVELHQWSARGIRERRPQRLTLAQIDRQWTDEMTVEADKRRYIHDMRDAARRAEQARDGFPMLVGFVKAGISACSSLGDVDNVAIGEVLLGQLTAEWPKQEG